MWEVYVAGALVAVCRDEPDARTVAALFIGAPDVRRAGPGPGERGYCEFCPVAGPCGVCGVTGDAVRA